MHNSLLEDIVFEVLQRVYHSPPYTAEVKNE
jgi:hypothetical protein